MLAENCSRSSEHCLRSSITDASKRPTFVILIKNMNTPSTHQCVSSVCNNTKLPQGGGKIISRDFISELKSVTMNAGRNDPRYKPVRKIVRKNYAYQKLWPWQREETVQTGYIHSYVAARDCDEVYGSHCIFSTLLSV